MINVSDFVNCEDDSIRGLSSRLLSFFFYLFYDSQNNCVDSILMKFNKIKSPYVQKTTRGLGSYSHFSRRRPYPSVLGRGLYFFYGVSWASVSVFLKNFLAPVISDCRREATLDFLVLSTY